MPTAVAREREGHGDARRKDDERAERGDAEGEQDDAALFRQDHAGQYS
jgi:hypothetical protein